MSNGSGLPDDFVAAVYPAEREAAPTEPPVVALCLSGGGSRALTCALGQLSALTAMPDPTNGAQTVMQRFDHLSSVSGGSWASVVYTFLPEQIGGRAVGDAQLLVTPTEPSALVTGTESDAAPGNVAHLDKHSLGTVPQRFDADVIAETLWKMYRWGMFGSPAKRRWFWIIAIGEIVLAPFDLYGADYPRRKKSPQTSYFFSDSKQYVRDHLTAANPDLDIAEFHTVRPGRTPLIVNTNLVQDDTLDNPRQIPVQATPIGSGALGRSPDGTLVGGGSVESFAFTSTLRPTSGAAGTANVRIDRRYSLADIAGCSSAFYATAIVDRLNKEVESIENEVQTLVAKKLHSRWLAERLRGYIHRKLQPLLDADAEDLIPAYNYWPIADATSPNPTNTSYGFADGGDFENTGVLGALARTDASRILSCVNAGQGLTRDSTTKQVILDGQLAVLFGYRGTPVAGVWESFGGMSPSQPRSYSQVFSDDDGAGGSQFTALREGLFQASCGTGTTPDTAPAAFMQTLTTVENPVAGISAGRTVTVLWIYNNRVDDWQRQITDSTIVADLARGQGQNQGPLAHFPWYTTAGEIHLSKTAVNMLAQLSAWNVQQIQPMIADLLAP